MSDLKTLKDLEAHFSPYVKNIVDGTETRSKKSVTIEDLKDEAVKWAKYFNTRQTREKIADEIADYARVDFIMKFFNLTEEDLKDEKY